MDFVAYKTSKNIFNAITKFKKLNSGDHTHMWKCLSALSREIADIQEMDKKVMRKLRDLKRESPARQLIDENILSEITFSSGCIIS